MNNDKSLKLHNLELLQRRLNLEVSTTGSKEGDPTETAAAEGPDGGSLLAPANSFLMS